MDTDILERLDLIIYLMKVLCVSTSFCAAFSFSNFVLYAKNQRDLI